MVLNPKDFVHPITLPTPFPVGPVNTYVIRADPVTIVDCGPNTPEARDVMCAGLRRLGLTPEMVRRVVLTHGHADHMGLAAWFEEQGADIYVHSLELGKLHNHAYWRAGWLRLLTESGAPEEAVAKAKSEFDLRTAASAA